MFLDGGIVTVTYLLPDGVAVEERVYSLSHPVASGAGLTLGLLSNGFPDTENFLDRLADALSEALPGVAFRVETKAVLSAAVQEPQLSRMAADCEAVIVAWGHCGSCTAGVTRDAMAFAELGVPTATLICDVFWDYAGWMARTMGMPALPRVRIPYPVAGTGEARQREVARAAVPEILLALRAHQ